MLLYFLAAVFVPAVAIESLQQPVIQRRRVKSDQNLTRTRHKIYLVRYLSGWLSVG